MYCRCIPISSRRDLERCSDPVRAFPTPETCWHSSNPAVCPNHTHRKPATSCLLSEKPLWRVSFSSRQLQRRIPQKSKDRALPSVPECPDLPPEISVVGQWSRPCL